MSSAIVENIENILKESGFEHRIIEHKPVFTSQEAADVRGVELKTGAKALVLKTKNGDFVMGICPGDKRLDMKKISGLEGSRVSFASREEVLEITDCEPGSVPPFGYKKMLKTYLDKELLENEWVNFNIGLHTKSAHMKSKDMGFLLKHVLI